MDPPRRRLGRTPRRLPEKVGQLTVIGDVLYRRAGHRYILCLCRCGNKEATRATTLLRGRKEACGVCTRKQATVSRKGTRTHPLYRRWKEIKAQGLLSPAFSDPRAFIQWARKNGYHRRRLLRRKDDTQPYSPENAVFL